MQLEQQISLLRAVLPFFPPVMFCSAVRPTCVPEFGPVGLQAGGAAAWHG